MARYSIRPSGLWLWLAIAGSLAAAAHEPRAAPDRQMAVTIDDLPANCTCTEIERHRDLTTRLVAALRHAKVPAVGFVNESKLYEPPVPRDAADASRANPQRMSLLDAWLDAGLELGNHTFSHPDLHTTSVEVFERDVLQGALVTRALAARRGGTSRFFRHPMLHTGRSLEVKARLDGFLATHGYRVAPVTIDSSEWIFARAYDHALDRRDAAQAARVVDAYVPYMEAKVAFFERQALELLGRDMPQVLLLHANRLNAEAFGAVAAMIAARGYRFIPLDEALRDAAYQRPDRYTGQAGLSWIQRWAFAEDKPRSFFAGEPRTPAWVLALAGIDEE